jgi:EAL domain/Sensory domain in DIguanylate Cyclases and Two-component system
LVAQIRACGWGIALDDVGAVRDFLALLPLLRPDVIQLDLPLVQRNPTAQIAEIVSAVNAEAERSGTIVLAEGIETEAHRNVALSFGATLGQGLLLGRPAALPAAMPDFAGTPVRIVDHVDPIRAPAPFALGAALPPTRIARKQLLIEISKLLERQAINCGESTVVLATFQDASFFTPATSRRYRQLVSRAAFVGALGEGMPAQPLAKVRGCIFDPDDPLIGEWDIIVVGPHFVADAGSSLSCHTAANRLRGLPLL